MQAEKPLVDRHVDDWLLYILGVLLALGWKYWTYVRVGQKNGKTLRESTLEWFFEKSAENATSWATTFGILWVFGDCYINRVQFLGDWLQAVPVVKSISFLFGSMTEYVVPNIMKWVVNKIMA